MNIFSRAYWPQYWLIQPGQIDGLAHFWWCCGYYHRLTTIRNPHILSFIGKDALRVYSMILSCLGCQASWNTCMHLSPVVFLSPSYYSPALLAQNSRLVLLFWANMARCAVPVLDQSQGRASCPTKPAALHHCSNDAQRSVSDFLFNDER